MKILRAKTRAKNKYLKGRYYKGTYRGIKCDSRWELAFLLFCLAHGKFIVIFDVAFPHCTIKRLLILPDYRIKIVAKILMQNH